MRFVWFRALMMTVSLIVVVSAIRNMNNRTLAPSLASVMGLPATSGAKVAIAGRLNWCETRVEALALANGTQIRQENFKWYRISPTGKQEVDSLAMEKWLGRNCTVDAELTQNSASDLPKKMLIVNFIKGKSQALLRYPTGEFAWAGQTFKSPELANALLDLESLPSSTR